MRLNPTQRRFFALYITFFLCVLLLLFPFYILTVGELERNVVKTSEEVLAGGLTRLEDEIRLILLAGTTLYKNQRLVTISYMPLPFSAPDAYHVRQALGYMDDMTSMLEMTSDFGIVLQNKAVLANGRLHLLTSDFFPKYLTDNESANMNEWIARLVRPEANHSFTAMRMTTNNGTRDTIVIAMALPYGTAWNRAVLFALMDQSRILDLLALSDTLEHAQLTLSDSEGNPLVMYAAGNLDDTVLLSLKSVNYGLSVELLISRELFAANLISFRNIVLLCLGLLIVLGFALSMFFSWRNAKPVMGVLEAAQATGEAAGGSLGALDLVAFPSGFEYLGAFLGEVNVKLRDNRVLLATQEQALRENLLERLVRGEVYSQDTFDVAKRYLPDFPSPCHMVLVRLHGVQSLDPDDYSKTQLDLVDALALSSHEAGGYAHFTANLLVLLLPVLPDGNRQMLESWLSALSIRILDNAGIETHMAVGSPFDGMNAMAGAFRRLRQLLRNLDGAPSGTIRFQEDFLANTHNPVAQNSHRFYETLVRGDGNMALALLNEDLTLLRALPSVAEADVQQFFFLYRHALSQAQEEWNAENQTPPPLPEYRFSWQLEEVFDSISDWTIAFCAARAARVEDAQAQLAREIIRAVDNNLDNPNLCIRLITEAFRITEAHLQRIMHQTTGDSFFKYVDQRRMARAKDLLLRTQLPVTQIIARCGYSSSNSFYKAFKRSYGVSPIALREDG